MAFDIASNSMLLRIGYYFQSYALTDLVLPFLLIFTVLFAVFSKIELFGKNKKNIHLILSLLMSVTAVVPHITRRYPYNYDPVVIINALIPSAAVLAVTIILILFLLGIWGVELSAGIPGIALIIILGVLLYVFGVTVGWWSDVSSSASWWSSDVTVLVIIILVFGVIIAFITSDEKSSGFKDLMEELLKPRGKGGH